MKEPAVRLGQIVLHVLGDKTALAFKRPRGSLVAAIVTRTYPVEARSRPRFDLQLFGAPSHDTFIVVKVRESWKTRREEGAFIRKPIQ